ncbi:MAG TPA: hypothetical protein VN106_09225 [Sphingomicrobium sp.]|nr:hypothetical protein [Sphingomicrobium sp.]
MRFPAPWGECQRCGFKRHVNELVKEWTGLRVCRDTCKDPKPKEMRAPKAKPEGLPVPNAAPETAPIFGHYSDGSHL